MYLDIKISYQDTFCNCSEKYGKAAWCHNWWSVIREPFCVLNGGLHLKFCPGASPYAIYGQEFHDYYSSDSTICKKSACK